MRVCNIFLLYFIKWLWMKLAYLSHFWQHTLIYHGVLKYINRPSLRSLQIHILTLLMWKTYYTPVTFWFCFLMSWSVQPFYKNNRSFIYSIYIVLWILSYSGIRLCAVWSKYANILGECTVYNLRVDMYSCWNLPQFWTNVYPELSG